MPGKFQDRNISSGKFRLKHLSSRQCCSAHFGCLGSCSFGWFSRNYLTSPLQPPRTSPGLRNRRIFLSLVKEENSQIHEQKNSTGDGSDCFPPGFYMAGSSSVIHQIRFPLDLDGNWCEHDPQCYVGPSGLRFSEAVTQVMLDDKPTAAPKSQVCTSGPAMQPCSPSFLPWEMGFGLRNKDLYKCCSFI